LGRFGRQNGRTRRFVAAVGAVMSCRPPTRPPLFASVKAVSTPTRFTIVEGRSHSEPGLIVADAAINRLCSGVRLG
jgi:hypothetical protein